MTNYITTLKSLKLLLEKITQDDKIFLIAKRDESLKIDELEAILEINKMTNNNFEISPYTIKDEFQIAVGKPIIENPEDNFILADSSLPLLPMFGNRVQKLTARKPKATTKRTKKVETKDKSKRILSKPTENINQTVKIAKEQEVTINKINEDKVDKNDAVKNKIDKNKIVKELKELLQFNLEDLNFYGGEIVFYLCIAKAFEKGTTKEEVKPQILKLEEGETIWNVIDSKYNSVVSILNN